MRPATRAVAELAKSDHGDRGCLENDTAVFTRDGWRILFVSNRARPAAALRRGRVPTVAPCVSVTTSERIAKPVALADGKSVVFLSDFGADENWSLCRVGLDGSGLVELTPESGCGAIRRTSPTETEHRVLLRARPGRSLGSAAYALELVPGARETKICSGHNQLPDWRVSGRTVGPGAQVRATTAPLLMLDLAKGTAVPLYPNTFGREGQHLGGTVLAGRQAPLSVDRRRRRAARSAGA